jgi:hypothetical protein
MTQMKEVNFLTAYNYKIDQNLILWKAKFSTQKEYQDFGKKYENPIIKNEKITTTSPTSTIYFLLYNVEHLITTKKKTQNRKISFEYEVGVKKQPFWT